MASICRQQKCCWKTLDSAFKKSCQVLPNIKSLPAQCQLTIGMQRPPEEQPLVAPRVIQCEETWMLAMMCKSHTSTLCLQPNRATTSSSTRITSVVKELTVRAAKEAEQTQQSSSKTTWTTRKLKKFQKQHKWRKAQVVAVVEVVLDLTQSQWKTKMAELNNRLSIKLL